MKRIVVWNPYGTDGLPDAEDNEVFSVYCTVVDQFHHAPHDRQIQYWETLAGFAKDHPDDPKLVKRVGGLLPPKFRGGAR